MSVEKESGDESPHSIEVANRENTQQWILPPTA
jgi:hypothetical protein